MTLILPDSRFENPQMFYPNRKPIGSVQINHELGEIARWDDLYINGLLKPNDGIARATRIDEHGSAWDYTGTFDTLTNNTFKTVVKDLTALLVLKADAITANDLIMQTGVSNAHSLNFAIWADTSGFYSGQPNLFSIQINTARMETPAQSFAVGKHIVLVFSWKGGAGEAPIVCINGEKSALTLSSTNPAFIPSNGNLRLGGYAGTLNDFNGALYMAGLRRGALSEAECISLSKKPYQFLIPA